MPLYDYRCEVCAEVWEENLPMKFRGFVTCPVCQTGRTQRIHLQAPATVMNWWDASSSMDASGIRERFRPRADNKKSKVKTVRRHRKKEMAYGER